MMKSYKIIIILLVILVLFITCNNSNNIKEHKLNGKNISKVQAETELDKTKENENSVELNHKENNNDNNETNIEDINVKDQNTDEHSIKEIKNWIKEIYKRLKLFSDKEMEEQAFVKTGKNLSLLRKPYTDLYVDLEDMRTRFIDDKKTLPDNIPEIIYNDLKKSQDLFYKAMDYRLKSLQSMILLIEEIITNGEIKAGKVTNVLLDEYQSNIINYDNTLKELISYIKTVLKRIGYTLDFKTGEISQIKENK